MAMLVITRWYQGVTAPQHPSLALPAAVQHEQRGALPQRTAAGEELRDVDHLAAAALELGG
jgi:hypothetical protein